MELQSTGAKQGGSVDNLARPGTPDSFNNRRSSRLGSVIATVIEQRRASDAQSIGSGVGGPQGRRTSLAGSRSGDTTTNRDGSKKSYSRMAGEGTLRCDRRRPSCVGLGGSMSGADADSSKDSSKRGDDHELSGIAQHAQAVALEELPLPVQWCLQAGSWFTAVGAEYCEQVRPPSRALASRCSDRARLPWQVISLLFLALIPYQFAFEHVVALNELSAAPAENPPTPLPQMA